MARKHRRPWGSEGDISCLYTVDSAAYSGQGGLSVPTAFCQQRQALVIPPWDSRSSLPMTSPRSQQETAERGEDRRAGKPVGQGAGPGRALKPGARCRAERVCQARAQLQAAPTASSGGQCPWQAGCGKAAARSMKLGDRAIGARRSSRRCPRSPPWAQAAAQVGMAQGS